METPSAQERETKNGTTYPFPLVQNENGEKFFQFFVFLTIQVILPEILFLAQVGTFHFLK